MSSDWERRYLLHCSNGKLHGHRHNSRRARAWGLVASGNDMCKIVAEIFFATVVAAKRKLLARNNKKMPLLPPKFNERFFSGAGLRRHKPWSKGGRLAGRQPGPCGSC